MTRLPQKYTLLLIGILIGVAYGLLTRISFGEDATLASVTYLFIIPTILGVIPLMFADNDQLKSYRNIIFIPWLTVATFFMTMVWLGIEDFICLVILASPFFILGTIGAFVFRFFLIRREKRNRKVFTLLLIPFVLSPVEEIFNSPSSIYKIESTVVIAASREEIWNNIVEVKPIRESEYTPGFFNDIGIPRPLSADVNIKGIGGQRIGHFEGGLRFVETITQYKPHQVISFDIEVDPISVRSKVFDQHVLKGNYFKFMNATYELASLPDGKTELKLSSSYQLTSKINLYGEFWGDLILKDFQDRLLMVIKNRCEKSE